MDTERVSELNKQEYRYKKGGNRKEALQDLNQVKCLNLLSTCLLVHHFLVQLQDLDGHLQELDAQKNLSEIYIRTMRLKHLNLTDLHSSLHINLGIFSVQDNFMIKIVLKPLLQGFKTSKVYYPILFI